MSKYDILDPKTIKTVANFPHQGQWTRFLFVCVLDQTLTQKAWNDLLPNSIFIRTMFTFCVSSANENRQDVA